MGGLLSIFSWNRQQKGAPLDHVGSQFDTGDVILFAGRGVAWYLTKIGTWSGFSNVGFLVRDKPGLEGLLVCYSGAPVSRGGGQSSGDAGEFGRVRISRLARFLEVGDFDLVVVRKLWSPLDVEEKSVVEGFARSCKGKVLKARVSLLMAPSVGPYDSRVARCCSLSCCSFAPHVERFFCSELVVGMLEKVGRVSKNNNEYVPATSRPGGTQGQTTSSGKVLGPAIPVRMPDELTSFKRDAPPNPSSSPNIERIPTTVVS